MDINFDPRRGLDEDGINTVGFTLRDYGTELTKPDGSPVDELTDEERARIAEALKNFSEGKGSQT